MAFSSSNPNLTRPKPIAEAWSAPRRLYPSPQLTVLALMARGTQFVETAEMAQTHLSSPAVPVLHPGIRSTVL